MTITHLLEDFASEPVQDRMGMSRAILDEERLSSFEQGYQAGWDDSLKAAGGSETKALDDMAKALSSMSVSQQEIYTELLVNLRPFINGLVDSVLPLILQESLGVQIKSLIHDHVEKNGNRDIVISVGKGQGKLVERIATHLADLPLKFDEVTGMEPNQVRVNFGALEESEIDTHGLVRQIKTSIDQFFESDVGTTKENTE